ncbi:hypothetical protein O181_103407 [Austropuccinia psidii MF-1]|uniref:T4 RNA ligase 1-like N-terminal domain-containing protein n=1 Tax=Austropuccinia psidii MF-1 TaxID=1389203 RepID=A0A9Q3PKE9_9BASI|nr:hypothetical protein [Austropuccinia psidii MF-1]
MVPLNQTLAQCAKHWGFHQTPYITLKSLNEVKDNCSQIQLDGWTNIHTPIEGIVVRAAPNQTTFESLNDPQPAIFCKVKFEEPYLAYQRWREITRQILGEIQNLVQTWIQSSSHMSLSPLSIPGSNQLAESLNLNLNKIHSLETKMYIS